MDACDRCYDMEFSASAMRRRKESVDAVKDIKSFMSRNGGVTSCDISAKILSNYDAKLTKMVQKAIQEEIWRPLGSHPGNIVLLGFHD